MAQGKPSSKEIMAVFNKNRDVNEVATTFGFSPSYAKFMVAEAEKKLGAGHQTTTTSVVSVPVAPVASIAEAVQPVVEQATAVIEAVAPDAKATILVEQNDTLKKVEVPLAQVAVGESNPALAMLRSKVNAEDMIPEKIKSYVVRKVDNIVDDFASLRRNICLIGDSGTGKTTLVEQFAAKNRVPFLRVSCDETSSLKTLLGSKEIINGTTYFRGGVLLELIQMPSVVLFDEFNALHSSKLFFLHELLDNRRLFVQDADGGKVIKIHPDCQIFLACNPSNKNYGGTNKMNAALGNRTTVIDVPNIKVAEMKELFDCGTHTGSMIQFYEEASRAISDKSLRVAFSLRNIQRATEAIKAGIKPYLALRYEFYNAALLTASEVERDVFEGIALRIFGK